MSSDIRIFDNDAFGSVRVVEREGEPWFVANDVCEALDIANVSDAINSLDEDEKTTIGNNDTLNDFNGLRKDSRLVSESGLYSLIMRSRKPEAKAFKRWITHDVIPSIRKTGMYGVPKTYAEALRALAAEVELKEAEKQQRMLAEAQRDEAVRTKAQIGSRREATSMATASAATRKVHQLEDAIGFGQNYKQVKAISWLENIFAPCKGMYVQVGKMLSKLSKRWGYEVREIPDSQYGSLKAYHTDVIDGFHYELRRDKNMLIKYRKDIVMA